MWRRCLGILTWCRGNRDHLGGAPRERRGHCTALVLTPATTPNWGRWGMQFLVVGDCVRAIPLPISNSKISVVEHCEVSVYRLGGFLARLRPFCGTFRRNVGTLLFDCRYVLYMACNQTRAKYTGLALSLLCCSTSLNLPKK